MSNILLYKIIVRCEPRDGPPRPSAHHITRRLNKKNEFEPGKPTFYLKTEREQFEIVEHLPYLSIPFAA